MNCPKCNHPLEIQWEEPTGTKMHPDGTKTTEVVGHCWECDYDGRWNIDTAPSGEIKEYNLQQFYFG